MNNTQTIEDDKASSNPGLTLIKNRIRLLSAEPLDFKSYGNTLAHR